ncbi:hypothetical protein D9757_009491 [Collybiopsis confluens]|uniref:Uncharacterized protein n=1 Tax=Collybiopsis confluens TaxID=2823264 RepID=A0A8H5H4T8_9AGAR|nr:hypothetical protein D9757_009491 [Collybiopsis confluens]
MSVEYEPIPVLPMDLHSSGLDEKKTASFSSTHPCYEEDRHRCSQPQRCHGSRLKRVLIPAIMAFLALGASLAVLCILDGLLDGGISGGLLRRATDGTNSGNDSFVNNKFYLIVIFVGLFVVIMLAICLSAWCCKGNTTNHSFLPWLLISFNAKVPSKIPYVVHVTFAHAVEVWLVWSVSDVDYAQKASNRRNGLDLFPPQ